MIATRLLAATLLLFLPGLAACTADEPPAAVHDPHEAPARANDAHAAVEAVLERQEQAIREANMVALDALWSGSEGVYVFEQGGVDSSWASYRDQHLGPELSALEGLDFRHEDVRIRTGSNLAVATGRYVLTAHHNGEDLESRGVFTTVVEREASGWKIVHSHLSRRPRR